MQARHLVVRADASREIGAGHVMRCLALLQYWMDKGGAATLVTRWASDWIERFEDEEIAVHFIHTEPGSRRDAEDTLGIVRQNDAVAVVVDGYPFSFEFQKALHDSGTTLLVIDDCGHLDKYHADIILNQNISASNGLYEGNRSRLLLGPRYALLRREFRSVSDQAERPSCDAQRVFVSMGGTDPNDVTSKVIEALGALDGRDLKVAIVTGEGEAKQNDLKEVAATNRLEAKVHANVRDMSELMRWADIAISTGGSTCYELAHLGVPNVILTVADNQVENAKDLDRAGVSLNMGWFDDVSVSALADSIEGLLGNSEKLEEMSCRGRRLVDGDGVRRVAGELLVSDLTLRPAAASDCKLLWNWANDPSVRSQAFSTDPIPWEDHEQWFHEKLNNGKSTIFIAEDATGDAVGQIRFDVADGAVQVDVSIAANRRGEGYGSSLIRAGTSAFFAAREAAVVRALVKASNKASARSFEKAGYSFEERRSVDGEDVLSYIAKRHD